MKIEYLDINGMKHDLLITAEDHLVGMVYTIRRNGEFFCELVQNSDGTWMEVWDGITTRAMEYGALIDKYFR